MPLLRLPSCLREGGVKQRLLALKASAGSGKTFALVARYLALLFAGNQPSGILALTFTNKAAAQMRREAVERLEHMDESMCLAIAEAGGMAPEQIERRREAVLHTLLRSDLKIMTIDAFFNQVLRIFSWHVGLQPDFKVERGMPERYFEALLQSLDTEQLADLTAWAQFEAKKASDIGDFFELLYEKSGQLPAFDTAHVAAYDPSEALSWANKIAAHFLQSELNAKAKQTFVFERVEDLSAKKWLQKESLNYWQYKKFWIAETDIWLEKLKTAMKHYFARKERYFLAQIFTLFSRYLAVREHAIIREGALHFKDVEHLVDRLLHREDFTRFLYFRLDARIEHILIDEFQDTSVTQFGILAPIVDEIALAQSKRSFFYVGDTKQSIYRFRGGNKELFDTVAQRYALEVGDLEVNYRSKAQIVEFVNETFDYVQPPQRAHKSGGCVAIREGEIEALLAETLEQLFDLGVADASIAILVHENGDILKVAEWIAAHFRKRAHTHRQALVIAQPGAMALINLMRYAHARLLGRSGELFKLNFFTLIGQPYGSEPIEIALQEPCKMIKWAMDRYGLYDDAALKVLEFSLQTPRLSDFVQKIETFDEEMPMHATGGVNVLTIHKSKGLAFEHVIVCDRLKSPARDRSSVIFDYEGVHLKALRIKFTGRSSVDEDFSEVVAKEKRLQEEDAKNVAYVAMTRARNSLFVLKNPEKSAFDFLPLVPMERGALEVMPKAESPKTSLASYATLKAVSYGLQEAERFADHYSPNDYAAIFLGLAVHELFEHGDEAAVRNRYGRLCDIAQAITLAEKARDDPAYRMLTEGAQIFHEQRFIYREKTGIIDLLICFEDYWLVVDYKTATPKDEHSYTQQISFYIEAMQAIGQKPVTGYLYYLDTLTLKKVVNC